LLLLLSPPPPTPTLFPYTTLFRSLAVEIDVGAADVRGRDLGQHEHRNQRKEAPTARPRHRLIARIARPACRPIHVIRHVMSMAMIIPRRKSALFASRAKN